MRSEIDQARQKARERLARAGCRDEQRMLAALRYREHLGLMPPDPPAARGKPVGEREGERHGKDVAACEARGKAFADRPDRKSTRLNRVTHAQLVCRLTLEKKKQTHCTTKNV